MADYKGGSEGVLEVARIDAWRHPFICFWFFFFSHEKESTVISQKEKEKGKLQWRLAVLYEASHWVLWRWNIPGSCYYGDVVVLRAL